jgi:hypothetical protein
MTFAIVKGDTESEVLGAVAMARDVTERVERARCKSVILASGESNGPGRTQMPLPA